jgi:phage baseplate assembly protein V
MMKDVEKRIARAMSGVRQAFRGVLSVVNTAPNITLVQVAGVAGETVQDNELMQHYGFSSNPPPGSAVVVLPLGGKTSQAVIIASEHGQYRIKNLAAGETVIYNHHGDKVWIKEDGTIDVTASSKVTVHSPLVEVPTGDVIASGISLKHHKHGGVQAGAAQTGEPV